MSVMVGWETCCLWKGSGGNGRRLQDGASQGYQFEARQGSEY